MIQIHYDLFTNFWFHLLAQLEVPEPCAVYNKDYIANNGLVIPKNIIEFISKNLSVISHFPFYVDIQNIKDVRESLLDYLSKFDNKEQIISELKLVEDELFIFLEVEHEAYKEKWQTEVALEDLNNFKSRHLNSFIHALKFISGITDVVFSGDLHVWLIKAMPENRGKSVGFPDKNGFAIAVPAKNKMSDEIYFNGVHELAHYFTDRMLIRFGYELSTNKDTQAYIQRESLADFVTEMYFKDIGNKINSKWKKEFIPEIIEASLLYKYSKLVSGIDVSHFGKYSKEFSVEFTNQLEPIKDIFFVEKRNERIYFFLPLIGRMVGVPIRYFKNLSPIEFDEVYRNHFINAGLLVPVGMKYFRQSVADLKRCNGFVKKVRFHMTNKCNLRCKYCYLSSGDNNCASNDTDEINSEKAINYLNKMYGEDLDGIEVEFHGGGEPTLMIEEIKKIVAYIDSKTNKRTIRIQTNGFFATELIDWIVDINIAVSVSIDGDKEINDAQRTEGTEAFKKITYNIKKMAERGVNVSTVSVITEYSQEKLDSIYEFIKSLGVRAMMMNPVHSFLGRSQQHEHPAQRDADLYIFANKFLAMKQKADNEGIYLVSDFLPDFYQYIPRNYQCDACKAGVGIYGNGDVCSCTRAYDLGQGSSNPFVWANVANELSIEFENEERLRKRVTENMSECRHCLLKWNCAGDCLLQCHEISGDMFKVNELRCNAKKQFIIEYLKGLIPSIKANNVVLLHFPAVTPMLPPPGVNFLANYLIGNGIKCDVIDINKDMYFNYKDEWSKTFSFQYNYMNDSQFRGFIDNYFQKLLELIVEKSYVFLGISCFDNTFEITKIFLEQMKSKKLKNVFLGGPDVFMEVEKYKYFLSEGLVDALILKEGEKKVKEYVSGKRYIPGVITKENINSDYLHYKDEDLLDINVELPLLDYVSGYSDGKLAHQVMPICASRGCSSNCSFCSHKILWEGYRLRNVDDVINEMLFHIKIHSCNLFYFTDMLLNGSFGWIKEFVNKLTQLKDRMYWSAYVRIDSGFDEFFCEQLCQAGAVYLSFGIESNSQHVLDVVHKGTKVQDNEAVIPNVAKAGIFIHASFIIGLPEENVDDLLMTFDYIKRNIWNIDHVEIFFFENLPQSSGFEMSKEYIEKNSDKDKYQLKKELYDELIVKFNQIGSGFLSSRQLYSSEASVFKKSLNEFYRRKYTGEQQSGDEVFLITAEKMHKFKLEQIGLLNEYIERFNSSVVH
jgi:radical SAM protein with 4Fe4S-binding SPASM domain